MKRQRLSLGEVDRIGASLNHTCAAKGQVYQDACLRCQLRKRANEEANVLQGQGDYSRKASKSLEALALQYQKEIHYDEPY